MTALPTLSVSGRDVLVREALARHGSAAADTAAPGAPSPDTLVV